MNWQDVISKHYPAGVSLSELRRWLLDQLKEEFGGDWETTLLATPFWSDDIRGDRRRAAALNCTD